MSFDINSISFSFTVHTTHWILLGLDSGRRSGSREVVGAGS